LAEQARKKLEIDRAREEQFLRLKELNSPLPSPITRSPAPAPSTRPSSLFRPPQPVKETYRPTTSTIQDIQQASKNAELHQMRDSLRSQPATPQPRIKEPLRPSLTTPASQAVSRAGGSGQAWSNLFGSTTITSNSQPSRGTAGVPQTPPPIPEKRRGPIRMQLPLDDAEEEGVDVRASNGMSIADAMKSANKSSEGGDQSKRSKQWGIDMSRFTD
jgi:hypothetical protein